MSKKLKKFVLFTAVAVAVGSALVLIDKKRKAEEEPLFEDDDTAECEKHIAANPVSTSSNTAKASRTYINLV